MPKAEPASRRLHRQQVGGLLLLLGLIVGMSLYRAGFNQVFPHGWWHIW